MLPYLWLIPLCPLAGFVLVGLLGLTRRISDNTAHRIAIAASGLAFVLALVMVLDFSGGTAKYAAQDGQHGIAVTAETSEHAERFAVTPMQWMPLGQTLLRPWGPDAHAGRTTSLNVGWTFSIDALTCVMLLVVTGIGTLIHVYAVGYMKGERGYFRFFAYLNLFMAMMLTLVLAGNFLVMFVGWEGVGLCSYLLIGFYYDRMFDKETDMSCADCGRKAFLTNRVGDFGFVLGIMLLLVTFGTLDFSAIANAINGASSFWYGSALLTGIGVLLFVGATGKSAQIPLYVWLPDAMAGPTPVSALIHAATMVTAGVYMLARMSALYWHAPVAMFVVAIVGCATAVFAGTMGMAQYDIKKVLAYSTVSQLGYMFLGVGVGAYAAAVFHLVTHAFFKACLFLGAGSVIARAGHTNDMRFYGGLKKWMPTTRWTFLVATLAISGVPLLSGFMSKDEILAKSLFSTRGATWLWIFGTLGAVMTSFYMFRAYLLTFEGENRTPEELKAHLGESPKSMTNVLAVLAIGAVAVGFIGVPEGVTKLVGVGDKNWFAHKLQPVIMARGIVAAPEEHGELAAEGRTEEAREEGTKTHASALTNETGHEGVLRQGLTREATYGEEAGLFVLAAIVFGGGFLTARWAFTDLSKAEALGRKLAFPRRVLHRKWFVDEFYFAVLLNPFKRACNGLWTLDRWIVDGAVNGTARTALISSHAEAAFDRWVVDLLVNATGRAVRLGGGVMRRLQTGFVQSYAAVLVIGTTVLLAAYVLLTR